MLLCTIIKTTITQCIIQEILFTTYLYTTGPLKTHFHADLQDHISLILQSVKQMMYWSHNLGGSTWVYERLPNGKNKLSDANTQDI